MSEKIPNCKRDSESEASSISVSPLKKTKLDDDSSSEPRDVVVAVSSSSSSVASSAASASGGCSISSAGEDDYQSSSISSGCFSTETNGFARNDSTVVVDLEAHQISETETSTFITSNSRKERNLVNEEALGETTEMESSTATERDDGEKQREVSKNPTPAEIEEFFSEVENDDKQKRFIEKYNFDIVNDEPLEGRYKWDRLEP